jgi:hypothetical protein
MSGSRGASAPGACGRGLGIVSGAPRQPRRPVTPWPPPLQARHVELSQRLLAVARCVDGLEGRLAMYMGVRGDAPREREAGIARALDAVEGELSLAAAGKLQVRRGALWRPGFRPEGRPRAAGRPLVRAGPRARLGAPFSDPPCPPLRPTAARGRRRGGRAAARVGRRARRPRRRRRARRRRAGAGRGEHGAAVRGAEGPRGRAAAAAGRAAQVGRAAAAGRAREARPGVVALAGAGWGLWAGCLVGGSRAAGGRAAEGFRGALDRAQTPTVTGAAPARPPPKVSTSPLASPHAPPIPAAPWPSPGTSWMWGS